MVCDNHRKLAGNIGQEHIRFCSGMITGFPPGNAHVGLEMVNGMFHGSPRFIKGVPFIRITLNAGELAEIHVVVGMYVPFLQWCRAPCSPSPTVLLPYGLWGQTHLNLSERPFSWQRPAYFISRFLSFGQVG